jgi:putative ATPase
VGDTLFRAADDAEDPLTGDGPSVTGRGDEHVPLAARLRPATLAEVVGQEHLTRPDGPLARLATQGSGASVVLYGPPGTGKTTIAMLLGRQSRAHVVELSAVNAGVAQVRSAISEARDRLRRHSTPTLLFIDEVHRFSRTQQDALLPAVENGWVTLVAATTENPSFSLVSPLLSRSLVLELTPLSDDDLRDLLARAVTSPRGLDVTVSDQAADHLRRLAAGDGRRLLTLLEAAAAAATAAGTTDVDVTHVEKVAQRVALRYDRAGDQHYDVASALIKSVRGSDVDAALHYLARMAEAGEDPRFLARRLVISAAEDIGLADPSALPLAVAAAQAVGLVGWPEARIILAEAVIALALAPKSNAVYTAVDEAIGDVRATGGGGVPAFLRTEDYSYPHDDPRGVVAQQYLPDALAHARYYRPGTRGAEATLGERWDNLRSIIRSTDTEGGS